MKKIIVHAIPLFTGNKKATVALLLGACTIIAMPFFMNPVFAGSSENKPTVKVAEQWVNANHVRINLNGDWVDLELEPLADHLCASRHPLFRRYCVPNIN